MINETWASPDGVTRGYPKLGACDLRALATQLEHYALFWDTPGHLPEEQLPQEALGHYLAAARHIRLALVSEQFEPGTSLLEQS